MKKVEYYFPAFKVFVVAMVQNFDAKIVGSEIM